MVVKESFEEALKDFSKPKARKSDMFNEYLKLLDKYIVENATWTNSDISFECSNFSAKPYKNCCMDDRLAKISDNDLVSISERNEEEDEEDIEIIPQQRNRLVKKWGDKEDKDLIWLDQREKSYYETHDVPSDHINRSGVITLCQLELQEFEALCDGEDVKKILDSKSRVLSQMSFSPKKKAKEDSTSNALDLGTLIKKREEFAPIINKDPELDDVDKIMNISKALAGALCRTAKIESPMVEEFDKIMKDFTYEFSSNGEDND